MELSCYGFELQHFGIPVVWPLGLRGLLTGFVHASGDRTGVNLGLTTTEWGLVVADMKTH